MLDGIGVRCHDERGFFDPGWMSSSFECSSIMTKSQSAGASKVGEKLIAVTLGALISMAAQAVDAQANPDPVVIGYKYSVSSSVLGETREYLIYLPSSYDDTKYAPRSYPVLYLLDGGPLFPSAAGVVHYMSSNVNGNTQIPEMIVVAVPNTDRRRDLTPTHTLLDGDGNEQARLAATGGGDKFLRFFRDELFPEVESRYRTMPHRTIVGNSLGGLLALHALVRSPGLFQGYIANDPSLWWNDQYVLRQAKKATGLDRRGVQSVFISSAGDINDQMSGMAQEMTNILSTNGGVNLRVKYRHFEAEDHGSLYLPGLYYGLKDIFREYDISLDDVFEDTQLTVSHFQRLSKDLGIDFLPPESLVDSWGQFLLHDLDRPNQALELFEINASNYPQSANVYVSLGDAYYEMGKSSLAVENLEKAIEIDPHHFWADWTRETLGKLRDVRR